MTWNKSVILWHEMMRKSSFPVDCHTDTISENGIDDEEENNDYHKQLILILIYDDDTSKWLVIDTHRENERMKIGFSFFLFFNKKFLSFGLPHRLLNNRWLWLWTIELGITMMREWLCVGETYEYNSIFHHSNISYLKKKRKRKLKINWFIFVIRYSLLHFISIIISNNLYVMGHKDCFHQKKMLLFKIMMMVETTTDLRMNEIKIISNQIESK